MDATLVRVIDDSTTVVVQDADIARDFSLAAQESATAAGLSAIAAQESAADALASATAANDDVALTAADRAAVIAAIGGWGAGAGLSVPAATKDLLSALTPTGPAFLYQAKAEGAFEFVTPTVLELAAFQANVTADTGRVLYIPPHASTGLATDGTDGYWKRSDFKGVLRPEWADDFTGDGVASDHAAFRHLSSLGARLGYLHIRGTPGTTYRVGSQNANTTDAFGGGPFYQANDNPIEAVGLSSLFVWLCGATIKFNSGLKYGAFNPATGVGRTSTGSADNAHVGFLIHGKNLDLAIIGEGKLHGNSEGMVLGGDAPSAGYFECRHTGIKLDSVKCWTIKNLEIFNFLQDGWMTLHTSSGLTVTDDKRPGVVENVHAHDIGRSNFSILGGNQVTVRNSTAVRAGAAPVTGGGTRQTAPACAMDIEAETINREIVLDNVRLEQGAHGQRCLAIVSGDNADITVRDSVLVGRVWAEDPRIRFVRTKIYGVLDRVFGNQASDADNTRFDDCLITDATLGDTPLQTQSGLLLGNSSPTANGVRFDKTEFDVSRMKVNIAGTKSVRSKIVIRTNTTYLAAGSGVVDLGSTDDHDLLDIVDSIASNAPSPPYIVAVGSAATIRRSKLTSATPNIQWLANGATGHTGAFDNTVGPPIGIAINGDVGITFLPRASKRNQRWETAGFAAGRIVTLSTTGAADGDFGRFIRAGTATGAGTLQVGGLKNLAAGEWCEVTYSGAAAAWKLTEFGTGV